MLLAKIENNQIINIIDTDRPHDFPDYVSVPPHVHVGADIRFYHGDYTPKSKEELIADGLIEPDPEPEPIPEEEPPTDEELASMARARRDALLLSCDWIVVRSNELGVSIPEDWFEYRQALRDIPQQPGFPNEIEWPIRPNSDT